MAAANNISDCVIGKFTFKKRCNVSGSTNSSVIQGSSESDMSAAEIVPTDDTSRSPLQPIQLTNAINTNVPGPQFVSKHFVSTTKDEIAAGLLAGSRGSAPVGGPVAGSSGSAPVGGARTHTATDDTFRSPLQPIQLTNAINTNVPVPQFDSNCFVNSYR